MIRVTVEMVPHGDEARKSTLGTLMIVNDGKGDAITGHYNGELTGEYTLLGPRKGMVRNYAREKCSVWSLVGAFLKLWGHTKHPPADLIRRD